MTIAEALNKKEEAQGDLELAIVETFPKGMQVTSNWIRGKATFTVTNHEGEVLILSREGGKDIRRRYDSVEALF